MSAIEEMKSAHRAFEKGYIVVFDQKDGLEIEPDEDFADASEAYELCKEELFRCYADEPIDEDPEGRTLRQVESPDELAEGFQEVSTEYMFFRLSEKYDAATLEEVLAACSARCFFPPLYVFNQGKIVHTFG